MGVKNAMPVDRPSFDFYVETVKRLAPDAEWCGAGHRAEPDHAQRMVRRGRRPHPHRARGQPAARPRHAGAVERRAGRAASVELCDEVRAPGGDAGRRRARSSGSGPPDGDLALRLGRSPAALYGDAEIAALFADAAEVRGDARASRARSRGSQGALGMIPAASGRGDRARGRARSRSTRPRSPPAWPRPACRCRRWSPRFRRELGARARRLAALGRHQPGHRRHRAGAAARRGARRLRDGLAALIATLAAAVGPLGATCPWPGAPAARSRRHGRSGCGGQR